MMRKLQHASLNTSPGNADRNETVERPPPAPTGLLDQVEKCLQEGQPKKALEVLSRNKIPSAWSTNAVAVCLLRLGQADRAIELLRPLVLSGSLFLRPDVPTAWKVNFATALLMTDNLFGCLQVLRDIRDEQHPSVQRLRGAFHRWQKGLPLWQKIQWFLGGHPARRVELDYLPGEL